MSFQKQSQQELIEKLKNLLQTVGINPDNENAQKKAEEYKKVWADLTDLEIDKSKVKETIENERNGLEQSKQRLKEIANKLNLEVENKTPEEIQAAISKEIEKN